MQPTAITSTIVPTVKIISIITTGGKGDQGVPGVPGIPGLPGVGLPTGGAVGQTLVKTGPADYQFGFGTASNSSSQRKITQTNHGFGTGQILTITSASTYVLAQADTGADGEVVGMVSSVVDANNFNIITEGYVTGLSGLAAGSVYFLSPATAGNLTTIEPTTNGQIDKPLFVAETTNSGYFHNYRGIVVGASSGGSSGGGSAATTNISFKTAAYTLSNSDDIVIFNTPATCTLQNITSALLKTYTISNQDDTMIMNLVAQSGQTVGGLPSVPIYPGTSIRVVPNATNWSII